MRENEAAKRLQSIQTERFFREGEAGASRCLRTSVAETPSSIALPVEARDVIGLSKEATKNSSRESINTYRPRILVKTQKKAPSSIGAFTENVPDGQTGCRRADQGEGIS